jgi:hypothetical protein
MIRNFRQTLGFFGLITFASSSQALYAGEALQWPAGPNVCQGIWSYSEYQSCEDATHGQDLNRPIVGIDGERCGYEKMQNSCWHGREYEGSFDMPEETIKRLDYPYTAEDKQAFCDSKARALPLADHQLLGPVSVAASRQIWDCGVPEGSLGHCFNRRWIANITCRITIDHQIFGPSDSCGGYVDDTSRPKSCIVGYSNTNKKSPACASTSLTTGRGTDASALMNENWRYNFSCSTGDDLPADNEDQVQNEHSLQQPGLGSNFAPCLKQCADRKSPNARRL